jgi:starvation-inducible DNA-binding protein
MSTAVETKPNTSTINALNGLLADATVLTQKLRWYHWMVTGPSFFRLHDQFETMYDEWAEEADELAERIVALGGRPIGTLNAYVSEANITEDESVPSGSEMVAVLLSDLATLSERYLEALEKAEDAGDRTTANMLDDTRDGLQKTMWMLKAYLK